MVCILLPVAAFLAFRAGYHAGRAILHGERLVPTAPRVFRRGAQEESKEERKMKIVHDNIEAYGTNTPQKDVM